MFRVRKIAAFLANQTTGEISNTEQKNNLYENEAQVLNEQKEETAQNVLNFFFLFETI